MSIGELIHYVSEVREGLPYRLNVFPSARIGGYGNPKSLSLRLSIEYPLKNALLNISLSGRNLSRRLIWKVMLGTVTLTREFKPQVMARVPEGVTHASIVFDVTQILNKPGKYDLIISNESSESIEISEVGLIGVIPTKGATIKLDYWAGVVAVPPKDEYLIPLRNSREGRGGISIIVTAPSRNAPLSIYVSKRRVAKINGIVGTDEVVLRDVSVSKNADIVIRHEPCNMRYYPRNLLIHEVLSYIPLSAGPKVELNVKPIDEYVLINVENTGSSEVKDLVLVGISAGFMVFRKVVNSLKPGEKRELRIKVPPDKRSALIVRAIYYGVWGQTIVSRKVD